MSEQEPERLTSSDVAGMLTGSPTGKRPWWMPFSRPCYDKLRRCPGWAGGGIRHARVRRCDNGFLRTYDDNGTLRLWRWRCYRCPKCRVIVLPYMTRWLDYGWWTWKAGDWKRDYDYWRARRRDEKDYR